MQTTMMTEMRSPAKIPMIRIRVEDPLSSVGDVEPLSCWGSGTGKGLVSSPPPLSEGSGVGGVGVGVGGVGVGGVLSFELSPLVILCWVSKGLYLQSPPWTVWLPHLSATSYDPSRREPTSDFNFSNMVLSIDYFLEITQVLSVFLGNSIHQSVAQEYSKAHPSVS